MIKLFLTALLIGAQAFAASPTVGYPTATSIRLLKPNLDLNGQVSMLSGSSDPTQVATSAPTGSIYMNTTSGQLYRKLDAGSTTNWALATTGAIAQASMLGSVKITGCASPWTTSSTSFVSFPVQTGCVYTTSGSVSAPSTMIPAVTIPSLPAGELLFVYDGQFGVTGGAGQSVFRISDGTNVGREVVSTSNGTSTDLISSFTSSISYATAQSSLTIQIQGAQGNGSATASLYGTSANAGVIKVYYFPSQAQTVLTPALTPAYAGKQWLGATSTAIALGQSAAPSNTRTIINATGFSTYTLLGSAQNDSSTNIQTTATLPAGEYEAEFSGFMRASTAASGTTTYCVFDLWDGTNVLGSAYFGSPAQAATSIQDMSHLRGYFKLTGTTTKTIQLRGAKTAGDSSNASYCQVYADTSAASTGSTLMLTIAPRTQSVPMPVIANSVISSSAGVQRIESALASYGAICSASPCAITSGTPGVTSVTWSSTGSYTFNFATPFSSLPNCGIGSNINSSLGTITTSSVQVLTTNSGGTATNAANISINCSGAK